MRKVKLAPPTPEVQYLPAIFRRIESGDLRIPAFQRSFVWTDARILELLQSVYQGYPVGNLLFWKVDAPQLQVMKGHGISFPDVPEHYPLNFVLDGMQRLSTLFGVFNWQETEKADRFNVIFNLRTEVFSFYQPEGLPEACIHLSSLFVPRRLIETQKRLAELSDGDELIDRSITLHSIFQEYLIPTVTITGREVSEVVEIFERINSTGLKLNSVDFVRALTWSTGFDLSQALGELREEFYPLGFSFPSETFTKILAIMLGRTPTPDDMLTLRNASPTDLHQGIEASKQAIRCVVEFLKSQFHILSSEFVPYEGQVLVLAKLFSINPNPSSAILDVAKSWFWSISFSEGLRGKPAQVVANAINDAASLAHGNLEALKFRFNLSSEDLFERRLIRGKALSIAVNSMFAARGARSFVTGDLIDPSEYMTEFRAGSFGAAIPLSQLREVMPPHLATPKIFSNLILVTEADRKLSETTDIETIIDNLFERFGETETTNILESQFITSRGETLELSKNRNAMRFLFSRANCMYQYAKWLSSKV